jgi:hypothetical protein
VSWSDVIRHVTVYVRLFFVLPRCRALWRQSPPCRAHLSHNQHATPYETPKSVQHPTAWLCPITIEICAKSHPRCGPNCKRKNQRRSVQNLCMGHMHSVDYASYLAYSSNYDPARCMTDSYEFVVQMKPNLLLDILAKKGPLIL